MAQQREHIGFTYEYLEILLSREVENVPEGLKILTMRNDPDRAILDIFFEPVTPIEPRLEAMGSRTRGTLAQDKEL